MLSAPGLSETKGRRRWSRLQHRTTLIFGGLQFAGVAVLTSSVMWILGWRTLYNGPQGSDLTWHWHLATWVNSAFPWLPWWYQWDDSGVPYRELYPVIPAWIAVAVTRLSSLGDLRLGLQVVEFAIYPISALGIYAFFAWRLNRPLAGAVAAVLFFLSPLPFAGMYDFGLYANQVGAIMFMPALISLDAFFQAWLRGERGWRFRFYGLLTVLFGAAIGAISPELFPAPIVAYIAYTLAVPRAHGRDWLRWLVIIGPVLVIGTLALEAYWILPSADYLAAAASRSPALTFNVSQVTIFEPRRLFELNPLEILNVGDRFSLTPAVTLPAIAGAIYAVREPRLRPILALALYGIVFLSQSWVYAPLAVFPFATLFAGVGHRPAAIYCEFLVPMLAAAGLFLLPRWAAAAAGARMQLRWPGRFSLALVAALAGFAVLGVSISAFAYNTNVPGVYAYGPYGGTPLGNALDLWGRHRPSCSFPGSHEAPLCADAVLSSNFDVNELNQACTVGDQRRSDVALCAALGPVGAPHFDAGSDALVGEAVSWCRSHTDPVCSARYLTPLEQVIDLSMWRQWALGCFGTHCDQQRAEAAAAAQLFPTPPQRAELNSDVASIEMALHEWTGGAQAQTYASQVPISIGLFSYLEDSMLTSKSQTVKQQLAAILGIDYVVLSPAQEGAAPAYSALGWDLVHADPTVFRNPQPTGLASVWRQGDAVLVVGASQSSSADVYDSVFKIATQGAIGYDQGWLVRSPSPYIDDYSDAELAAYPSIILLGYRYHDSASAWAKLDRYVNQGGRLFVETGWQYVDPDWNLGSAPAVLPVKDLHWGAVDPQQPVVVNGAADPGWGSMVYGIAGWGASSAPAVKPGATALVTEGGRVLVASWQRGKGSVLWSGMNLLAHAAASQSTSEDRFLASGFQALLPAIAAAPTDAGVRWLGDGHAEVDLTASSQPVYVLFKESSFPGWTATLRTPGGSRIVPFQSSEFDYLLVRLDSIPPGSTLEFRYGPTWRSYIWWSISLLTLLGLLLYMARPVLYRRVWALVELRTLGPVRQRIRRSLRDDEDPDDTG